MDTIGFIVVERDKNKKRHKIFNLVNKHVTRGGSVLEVSCGEGRIISKLKKAGYEVRGTNYSAYSNIVPGVDIDFGVDINKGLPYGDYSFDCVILCDIIEHFTDHIAAIKEVSRIVKKDGYAIILTPNTMKIGSRLHFLLTGFFKLKRAFIGFDVPAHMAFVFHNNPPHLPVFLYHLHSHYLEYVQIEGVKYKIKSFLFWLLFSPLILPFTYIKIYFGERNLKRSDAQGGMLFKALISFQALCAEYWITVSKKVDSQSRSAVIKSKLPAWVQKSTEE